MTTFDFGNGPVPAHQHPNGGGWVADTTDVEDTVYVGLHAQVFEEAYLRGKCRVDDFAKVSGRSMVFDEAIIRGRAQVFGSVGMEDNAIIEGNAKVFQAAILRKHARVSGNARVSGRALLTDDSVVSGHAKVLGRAVLTGTSRIEGRATIKGFAEIWNTAISGRAYVGNAITGYRLDDVPYVENIHQKVYEASEGGALLCVGEWVTPDEKRASREVFAIEAAGDAGWALEEKVGPWLAGALIYVKSTGEAKLPIFYASLEEIVADVRAKAGVTS